MFETLPDKNQDPEARAANDVTARYHFAVLAEVEPSVLARVVELFSILSLVLQPLELRVEL